MKIPPEVQASLLAIVEIGIVNIRSQCEGRRYDSCEAEANHIHNLPALVQNFSADKVAYYLEVELPQYVREVGNHPRGDLLPHWEILKGWLPDFRNSSFDRV